ncbi:hypothetical protein MAR_001229 [Mya arenaria]|uniref:N-acetyltransferase domain-containing protein n=1 Tax=Mya arenaria TaxID=6604 RepID=A0ABY7FJG6_MYAAR|nr:hypothetical protein MAR_001229 [Mya arenaria]
MDSKKWSLKPRPVLEQVVQEISNDLAVPGTHIELASDVRSEQIVNFLAIYFYPDVNIDRAIGLVIDDWMKNALRSHYVENLSLLLIDDATDDVIGTRTIMISHKADYPITNIIKNKESKLIFDFLLQKHDEMNVFEHYGVNTVFRFVNLGIRPDYRCRGLASMLMEAGVRFCSKVGPSDACIWGEATSNASQRIYEKCGFETLHTLYYDDYKVDGEIVFKDMGEDKSTKVYVKKL